LPRGSNLSIALKKRGRPSHPAGRFGGGSITINLLRLLKGRTKGRQAVWSEGKARGALPKRRGLKS